MNKTSSVCSEESIFFDCHLNMKNICHIDSEQIELVEGEAEGQLTSHC